MLITEIKIKGLVQGVGFRPFVYHIAIELNLKGEVFNNSSGVTIRINPSPENESKFIDRIKDEAPDISNIVNMEICNIETDFLYQDFTITTSKKDIGDT